MTLTEHLRELRTRLLRAAIALVVAAAAGYAVFPVVLEVLTQPYCEALGRISPGQSCNLLALDPLEPFTVRIRTSLVIGLFAGAPVILYQLWRFITPGLTPRERRYSLPFVLLGTVLFALGIVFAYWLIPQGLTVLLELGGTGIDTRLSADRYLTFFLRMSIAFGLVFLVPLVLVFLSLAGVVHVQGLRRARPFAIVGMFTLAAFITPTVDVVTQLLVAGPMVVFYELAVAVAWLIERRRGTGRR